MPKSKTGSKKRLVTSSARRRPRPLTIQEGAEAFDLDREEAGLDSQEDDEAEEVFPPSQSQQLVEHLWFNA